jgi:hypothetical protein
LVTRSRQNLSDFFTIVCFFFHHYILRHFRGSGV